MGCGLVALAKGTRCRHRACPGCLQTGFEMARCQGVEAFLARLQKGCDTWRFVAVPEGEEKAKELGFASECQQQLRQRGLRSELLVPSGGGAVSSSARRATSTASASGL